MFAYIVISLNVLILTVVNGIDVICDSKTGTNCVCNEEPCFRKCCQLGEIYENEKCVKYNGVSSESVHVKLHDHNDIEVEYSMRMVKTLIYGVPCNGIQTGDAYLVGSDYFKLFVNGSMELLPRNNFGKNEGYSRIDVKNYCSDIMKRNGDRVVAVHCPVEEYELSNFLYYGGFCIFVSLPFLLATEAVFVFLETTSNNLARKITINQIFALFVGFLILADIRYVLFSRNMIVCKIFGYLVQYSILSNFFWLNVMCFDIWLVFSGLSTPYRNLTKDKEWRKFLKYAAYAWGMPILICFATYLAEYLPTDSKFRPGVGESYCLLQKNYSRTLFYFGPLTIILIANVLMFSATAYKIFEHKKQMKVLKSDGSNINNNAMEKERLNLYFKLFLVMGITWIAEPISELFNEEPDWLWILLDSINLLQGIPIFIIFVCKRRTLRAINAKLCPSKQFFGSSRRESSNTRPRRNLTSTSSLTSCCPKNSISITPNKQNNDLEMVPKEKKSKSYNVAVIA